jgi:hypothetical protein
MSIETEVVQCFKENPELIFKRINEIAEFFYIQGQLHQSNISEAMRQKYVHYRKTLPTELRLKADEEWKVVND